MCTVYIYIYVEMYIYIVDRYCIHLQYFINVMYMHMHLQYVHMNIYIYIYIHIHDTLPETNSSPLKKKNIPKGNFQPSICLGYVSFREGIWWWFLFVRTRLPAFCSCWLWHQPSRFTTSRSCRNRNIQVSRIPFLFYKDYNKSVQWYVMTHHYCHSEGI